MTKTGLLISYLGREILINTFKLHKLFCVATDRSGEVTMYFTKPIKDAGFWRLDDESLVSLNFIDYPLRLSVVIPNVHWESSLRFYVRQGNTTKEITEEHYNFLKEIMDE